MTKTKPLDPVFSPEIQPYGGELPHDGKFRDFEFENSTLRFDFCEEFNGCRFKKIRFTGDLSKTTFVDCLFDQCDLSNLSISKSQFIRVRFENCKGTGSTLRQSRFKAVLITHCVFDLSDFSESTFEHVRFIDSRLSDSAFQQITQTDFVTERIDFTETDFTGTRLAGMDLSSCTLDGLRVSPDKLKGLCVNELQAVALVALLGVKIKDRQS